MIINQEEECLLVIANSKVRPRHSRCSWKVFLVAEHRKAFPNSASLCRCPGIQVSCAAGMFPLPEVPTLASASQESQPRPIRSQHLPTWSGSANQVAGFRGEMGRGQIWMDACLLRACCLPSKTSKKFRWQTTWGDQIVPKYLINCHPLQGASLSWWKDARYTNCLCPQSAPHPLKHQENANSSCRYRALTKNARKVDLSKLCDINTLCHIGETCPWLWMRSLDFKEFDSHVGSGSEYTIWKLKRI